MRTFARSSRQWGILGLALAALGCGAGAEPPSAERPNVLLVVVDTLRADAVGHLGGREDVSPTIDALAAAGTTFTNATTTSPWTVPATASLLTGVYPPAHGAYLPGPVKDLTGRLPSALAQEVPYLPELLRENGWRTGLFSANPYLETSFFRGFRQASSRHRYARELTDEALRWLGKHRGRQRFFAHLQYLDLHIPLDPPAELLQRFLPPDVALTEAHRNWAFERAEDLADPALERFAVERRAVYDAALAHVDAQLGRILAELEVLGVRDRTLVIVTSDHGEEFWEHAEIERALGSDPRGIWGVGHGHTFFREQLHVPLVVAGPGLPGSRRVDCPVSLLDILPTVFELSGLPSPPGARGASLLGLIHGTGECGERPMVASSPAYGPSGRAICFGAHKLIVRDDGTRLLYDLAADPAERVDLAAQRPELVLELEAMVEHELAAGGRVRSGEMSPDARRREQLRTLGYLD